VVAAVAVKYVVDLRMREEEEKGMAVNAWEHPIIDETNTLIRIHVFILVSNYFLL
jgi:hypothetical protein